MWLRNFDKRVLLFILQITKRKETNVTLLVIPARNAGIQKPRMAKDCTSM